MNFLNKLERKFGRYAIRNLSLYIIIAYAIGYALSLLTHIGGIDILGFVRLNPALICKGQVWRVISWVIVPPSNIDIFTIIMLYFYYQIGNTLEATWGPFRYNVYIFSGILFSLIGAFGLYFFYAYLGGVSPAIVGEYISQAFSTYYINLSIFLAFAAVYPNIQVLLFFVIPVKMKYLAYIDVIMLVYSFFANRGLAPKLAIIMSVLNFIVFFFATRDYKRVNPKEVHRRNKFKREYKAAAGNTYKSANGTVTKHKCAICGRTELDGDNLEFRFCSKCNGNYEYCQDHLFTHEHIKGE